MEVEGAGHKLRSREISIPQRASLEPEIVQPGLLSVSRRAVGLGFLGFCGLSFEGLGFRI